MHELTSLLLIFTAGGLVLGGMLGAIGNSVLFRAALAPGCLAAVWLTVSAVLDHGWGRIGKIVYAALVLWGIIVGAGVYGGIRAMSLARAAKNKDNTV